jgi:hypothetical protein
MASYSARTSLARSRAVPHELQSLYPRTARSALVVARTVAWRALRNWAFVPQWLLLALATGGLARVRGEARAASAAVVVALLPVILLRDDAVRRRLSPQPGSQRSTTDPLAA